MNLGIIFKEPVYLLFLLLWPFLIIIPRLMKRTSPVKERYGALILRLFILCLCIGAVSGLHIGIEEERINYIFLLDVSDSIEKKVRDEGMSKIKEYSGKKKPTDTVSVISFGRNARFDLHYETQSGDFKLSGNNDDPVESQTSGYGESPVTGSVVDSGDTNIEKAVQLACAHLSDKGENRIVLFSDGNETSGSLLRAARLAKGSNVPIFVYPLDTHIPEKEALVKKIYGPTSVYQEEPHEIHVIIESSMRTGGILTLLRDKIPFATMDIELNKGENLFTTRSILKTNGLHIYEALLYAESDTYKVNNLGKLFIQVRGRPGIFYVYGRAPNESLLAALTVQGIDITKIPHTEIPGTLAALSGYSGIIFDNVPGQEISFSIMNRIEEYVRTTGGGFFMITGSDSYGFTGFSGRGIDNRGIDAVLPVYLLNQEKFSSLAVVFAVDRSASMEGDIDIGKTKLDIVKSALFNTIDKLKPTDSIAVLAFDTTPEWIVRFEDSVNKNMVHEKISALSTSGGTNIFRALQESYKVLSHYPAQYRHIVLLSDGKSEKRETYDYQGLVKTMARDNITVSTIAVGHNADTKLLGSIAEWGNGVPYYTKSHKRLLTIYLDEMERIAKGYTNVPFHPEIRFKSSLLKGIDGSALPQTGGYIHTTIKPGAQEILSGPEGPLFATWRYGLGKAAVFLSDLQGTWGNEWLAWKKFPQFIAQTVRWIERDVDDNLVSIYFREKEDNEVEITADIKEPTGKFRNFLHVSSSTLFPDHHTGEGILEQDEPGLYKGLIKTILPGDYYISITGMDRDNRAISPRLFGFSIPYSPEYTDFSRKEELLRECADMTGGEILYFGDKDTEKILFQKSKVQEMLPTWGFLVTLAFILFFTGIIMRKTSISQWFQLHFMNKEKKQNHYNELRGYKDLKTIMEQKEKEEKERIREQIRERLKKRTGLSVDTPELFLALKRSQKK